MNKKFKFTISSLNNLPKNPASSKSTELEFTDTEVIGLKCLVGKTGNKRFLLRYVSPVTHKKASIALGRWPDIEKWTPMVGHISSFLKWLIQLMPRISACRSRLHQG